MLEKQKKIFLYLFLILSLIFVIGCTQDQKGPDTTNPNQQTPGENDETPNNDNPIDENITEPKKEVKYYVNKNNFLIKPVNPDDDSKVILLTFDDAPRGENTYLILDTLDKYEAKAIFFVTGYYSEKNKELLKEIYDRGHIIGNHTWSHPNLNNITSYETSEKEINKLNDLIYEVTGEYPKYFRPPYGALTKNENAKQILFENKMQSMNWSLGSRDWEIIKAERYQELITEVTNNSYQGANILMHDMDITAKALDAILVELKNQGYSFVVPTEVILE